MRGLVRKELYKKDCSMKRSGPINETPDSEN